MRSTYSKMRKPIAVLVLFFLAAVSCFATTPTKVEWVGMPAVFGPNPTQQMAKCARPAAAGDTVIVVGELGSNTLSTVTDNAGGNTWVQDKVLSGAQVGYILRASNVTAGTQRIIISLTGATSGTSAACFVMNDLATSTPVDVTCGHDDSSSGTSHACTSMTTTQTGDEILHCAFMDSLPTTGTPPTWTAASGFTLAVVTNFDAFACQFENQASAGAINPTLTSSSSLKAVNVGVAYKTATSGGAPPAGIYAPQIQVYNASEWNEQGGTALSGTSFTVNFPCATATQAVDIAWESNSLTLNSVSSTPSNTWTGTTPLVKGVENMGHFTASVSNCSSTFRITFSLSGTPNDSSNSFEAVVWAIQNTSGLDSNSPCNSSGTGAVSSGNIADGVCTTQQANELLTAFRQHSGETVTSSSTSGGNLYDIEPDIGTYASFSGNEDAGEATLYAGTAGSYTITWTYSNYEGGTLVGDYVTQTMLWKPAASGVVRHRAQVIQ